MAWISNLRAHQLVAARRRPPPFSQSGNGRASCVHGQTAVTSLLRKGTVAVADKTLLGGEGPSAILIIARATLLRFYALSA